MPPPHMVWTYFSLGRDLLGDPHPGRRMVLRNVLQALAWPAGSVAFWPLAVPEAGRYAINIRLFWRGLRLFGSKIVCCFGEDCKAVLSRELATPLAPEQTVLRYRTGLFLFLPDLDTATNMAAPSFASLCATLREHGPLRGGGR
ncbi:hypothetical protein JCM14635_11390 [Megalodesulfovibrio paquesii]